MTLTPPPSPWGNPPPAAPGAVVVQPPARRDLSTVVLTPQLIALASWHHPNYLPVESADAGYTVFRAFTGNEMEPASPEGLSDLAALVDGSPPGCPDPHGLRAACCRIAGEAEDARRSWHAARHDAYTLQTLYGAAAAITRYRAARADVAAAYAAISTAPDNLWRAAIARLVTARAVVLAEAREIDRLAGNIYSSNDALPGGCYLRTRGIYAIAKDANIDLTDAWPTDVGVGYGLVHDRRREYDAQDRFIAEINRLAGPPSS